MSDEIDRKKILKYFDLDKDRGLILSCTSQLEGQLEDKISICFLGKIDRGFITTVLGDPAISFHFLKSLFINFLEYKGLQEEKNFFEGRLTQFAKLRNSLVHGRVSTIWDEGKHTGTILSRGKTNDNFYKIMKEFFDLFGEIISKLDSLKL